MLVKEISGRSRIEVVLDLTFVSFSVERKRSKSDKPRWFLDDVVQSVLYLGYILYVFPLFLYKTFFILLTSRTQNLVVTKGLIC